MTSHGGADPSITSKELKSVKFYVQRQQRIDLLLFSVANAVAIGKILRDSTLGEGWSLYANTAIVIAVWACQILLWLFQVWMVDVKCLIKYKACISAANATHCKVQAGDFTAKKEIVLLERRGVQEEGTGVLSFEFRKQLFEYDEAGNTFSKLAFPVEETFEHYQKSTGFGAEARVAGALAKWGPNRFVVPLPSFRDMLKEQLVAPFFVFQVFCVGLWCLDDYWYYSLFTLGMLVMFECTVVGQRLRNLRELRSLTVPKQALQVYRQGRWDQLPGDALLPGDVISIGRPSGGVGKEARVVPADVLLLAGSCIVEEAVLTGESTPQWKTPIGTHSAKGPASEGADVAQVDPKDRLNIKRDKNFVLFSGTKVLQHTEDRNASIRTPDGGCLAVVLRTGFETSQGQLMRTILYSTERVTANNWEVGLFILFLLIFAVAAAAYVLYYGLQNPDRDRFKLFLNCTMIITSVIPPELPMELSIAVNASLLALARKAVFCTEPFRIPLAGKVAVCCFDKTGTLTSDDMVLRGLAGLPEKGRELLQDVKAAGKDTLRVLAACQSLIHIEGDLVGDPLERAAFEATGWTLSGGAVKSPKEGNTRESISIMHRFHFTSALKRMAVTVKVEGSSSAGPEYWVLLKGAPEVVEGFLEQAPKDFSPCYREYASQGGRVIALAWKKLDAELTPSQITALSREEIECGLTFGGFAVFHCPLKEDSEPALRMLKEASHQLVMITGDTPLTACHAAKQVHIVDRPVLILDYHSAPSTSNGATLANSSDSSTHFEWRSPDEAVRHPFESDLASAIEVASQYDLCLSGDALHTLQQRGIDTSYVPLTQVFARVTPDQKERILHVLRGTGWITLMCGDGTNDVGALKTAHVGVALLAPREKTAQDSSASASGASSSAAAGAAGGRGRGGRGSAPGAALPPVTPGRGRGSPAGPSGRGAPGQAGRGGAGRGQAKQGPGAKMLERMRQQNKPVTPQMEKMAAWMDGMDTEGGDGMAPMVKPGDASMASPFTAKKSSVMPCTDIIRQGRSTLVTTIQMFKILGLICLSTAYSLSVMYLQGVKLGDLQATVMGMLSAALFFVISHAKPLEHLSADRPHTMIFSLYVFASITGQFVVHMVYLILMYNGALAAMPEGEKQEPNTDFKPNLVNTVCFLVQFIIQLMTFAVNYQGPPFNAAIKDTKALRVTFFWGTLFFVLLTLDVIPGLAELVSLVSVPQSLAWRCVGLGGVSWILTNLWEQLLRRSFPSPRPPRKGYEVHKHLLRTGKGAAATNGALAGHEHAE